MNVRVACLIPNGLMIRLTETGPDDGTGSGAHIMGQSAGVRLNGPSSRRMGASATARQDLEPGVTEVEKAFMEKWLDQHKLDPAVTMRQVWILDENPPPQP